MDWVRFQYHQYSLFARNVAISDAQKHSIMGLNALVAMMLTKLARLKQAKASLPIPEKNKTRHWDGFYRNTKKTRFETVTPHDR